MHIKVDSLNGIIKAPPSKSHGQRLLLISAISAKQSQIENLGLDNDTTSMKVALNQLNQNKIDKALKPCTIDVAESGFAFRTLSFVGLNFSSNFQITGSGTLQNRNHKSTIELLEQLGLNVGHQDLRLPIEIKGEIKNMHLEVDGSEGSQHVSGLFFLAVCTPGNWKIKLNNLKSRPYFELSLKVLTQAGFKYKRKGDYFEFIGKQELELQKLKVEGDWSSMAAFCVGAAIKGKITLLGLNQNSLQPDIQILGVLEQFGANIYWDSGLLHIESTRCRKGFNFDCSDCPDLFPILVVLACAATSMSEIKGIGRLLNKESNRLHAMQQALNQWGVDYLIIDDSIQIQGKQYIKDATVETKNDHRIAMAGAIAALLNKNGQNIDVPMCVKKSYPDFFDDYKTLGALIN